jgi:hypothetical protein
MQSVFVDRRLDPGQVGDLMDQWGGVHTVQRPAAAPARIGLAVGGRAEPLGRDHGAERLAMAGLSDPLPPRRKTRRLAFQTDRVGGGRLAGVGGFEWEPGLELTDRVFQFGDPIVRHLTGVRESGLGVGGHGAPEWLEDRNLLIHI